jgi:hemolysin activation/secretion protein
MRPSAPAPKLLFGSAARRLESLAALATAVALLLAGAPARGADGAGPPGAGVAEAATKPAPRTIDINEFRVDGASQLSAVDVEEALYPYLGPRRVLEDVEAARAALEKAYSNKGYQSVAVAIPPQTVRNGVVLLQVTEGKVGRLRVRGSRYFSLQDIKQQAPSVAEGKVPNFDDIVRDIALLNQIPDRRVTPALRAGVAPGTVDVDLNVQDTLPLHGSIEYNNRYSSDTTQARLNGTLHYDNLWQAGHSLSFSFQLAPERLRDAKVFSASYLARIPDVPWLSLSANGVIQESNVSTLGSIAVRGRGRIFGARVTFTLPGGPEFFHSISTGVDYKHFLEALTLGQGALDNPIRYWPWTTQYGGSWAGEASQTSLAATVVFNLRGLSSSPESFDNKRVRASGSFLYYRGELSRTDDLPRGFQLFARVQGQYSSDPLVGSEQLTAGGADSVRGYLESQASGDYGALGAVELRSLSLARWFGKPVLSEWRLLAFAEGGRFRIRDPLPDQKDGSSLRSVGGGSRVKLFEKASASLDVGVPLVSEGATRKYRPRFHLRFWTEF